MSSDDSKESKGNLGKIFDQHYSHSRHQETQRLTFTTILTAVLGAIVAFTGSNFANGLEDQSRLIFILIFSIGWALSFVGFILMFSWNRPFIRHYILAEMIVVYYWHLKELSRLPVLEGSKTRLQSLLKVLNLIFLFKGNAKFQQPDDYNCLKLKAEHWHINDILLEPTSGNIFYVLMALYNILFAALIGSAIPGHEIPDVLKHEIFGISALQILVMGGSVFILMKLRIYFAYEELKARKEIIDKFDRKFGSQDSVPTKDPV